MARMYDNTDTDADLLRDWEDTGVLQLREIRSHRAPRRPFAYKTLITAGALMFATTSGIVIAGRNLTDQTHAAAINMHISKTSDPVPTTDQEYQNKRELRVDDRVSRGYQLHERMFVRMPQVMRMWVNPVKNAKITSCWGMRNGRMHKGIDFALPRGRDIKSVGSGKVVQAGWSYEGLGYSVVVDHGDGYMTVYGHASKVLVRTGQRISAGHVIAKVGSTGNSSGPHLHLGVARTKQLRALFNSLINPAPWLRSHDVYAGRCR